MSPQENNELVPEVKELETVFEEVTPEVGEQVGKELTEEELVQSMPKNIPYVKIENSEGDLANPITKGNPYKNFFLNRRGRKALLKKATKHPKNNKKGTRLVVTEFAKGKFIKTKVVKQQIASNTVVEFDEDFVPMSTTHHKAKTIIHNQTQI